jgi:hypothetical protein
MSITGITTSKLFKVKTTDLTDPYKVGVNGVISISGDEDGVKTITYVLDDITYTTSANVVQTEIYNFESLNEEETSNINLTSKKRSSIRNAEIIEEPKNGSKVVNYFKLDRKRGAKTVNQKTQPLNLNVNPTTRFVTNGFSYDNFTNTPIYKESKYVGLIDKPIIKSEIFMERDTGSVFERHQRLSEINSINELETYRNGYYENINTI